MAKPTSKGDEQPTGKPEFQHKPNHLGYLYKSKKGNDTIKVEQDIVLKKGDLLFLGTPHENAPDWKLRVVSKIVDKAD